MATVAEQSVDRSRSAHCAGANWSHHTRTGRQHPGVPMEFRPLLRSAHPRVSPQIGASLCAATNRAARSWAAMMGISNSFEAPALARPRFKRGCFCMSGEQPRSMRLSTGLRLRADLLTGVRTYFLLLLGFEALDGYSFDAVLPTSAYAPGGQEACVDPPHHCFSRDAKQRPHLA